MEINKLLELAFKLGASDVHLTANSAPALRLHGKLLPLDAPEWRTQININASYTKKLDKSAINTLAQQILSPEKFDQFMNIGELDFSYAIAGIGRCRVNAYRQQDMVGLAIRLINPGVMSYAELGLPKVLSHLARRPQGIVLVTGPTGSGKSTTLTTMIDQINREAYYHIITLEDPIEFIHQHKHSIIMQREIGRDSKSFTNALRAALRQDPDVILVGEMRDPETISTALTAAETGHLVFATLHTSNAAQTIDRIIDVFPPHQQQQIRVQLANTIQGVVAQQLVERSDQPGRTAVLEIMIATPAIRNLIREGKTYQIISQIQTGAKFGMISLDASLKTLCQKGIISRDEALNRASDAELLRKLLFT